LLDRNVLDAAADALTFGTRRPTDEEVSARYLGKYRTRADLARALYAMGNAHLDLDTWPLSHIDWEQAADDLFEDGGSRSLLNVGAHWFDALAAPPVVAAAG